MNFSVLSVFKAQNYNFQFYPWTANAIFCNLNYFEKWTIPRFYISYAIYKNIKFMENGCTDEKLQMDEVLSLCFHPFLLFEGQRSIIFL